MLRNYLAAALRNLRRNGLYAGITIAGLAVGFASAILIGLYLRHELTYDRFVPGHERVFVVNQSIKLRDKSKLDMDQTSAVLFRDLKLDFPQIEAVARMGGGGFPPVIRHGEVVASERSFMWADADFFKVVPVPAIAGDPGTALAAPDTLVLSRAAARKYFGRDTPLGGVLMVDGHPMRVTAVIEDLPSNSHMTGDVFASSQASFSLIRQFEKAGYASNANYTYVRLKPGASVAALDAAMPAFLARRVLPSLRVLNPDQKLDSYVMRLKPITDIHLQPPSGGGSMKPGADVKVLIGIGVIGVLIVVVAAINFVTLMTARASRRAVEVGVRKALGAQRRDLIAQFMGEAVVYVAVALVLGVAIAELLLPGVNAALQRQIAFDYLGDPLLLVAMLGVATTTAVLAGVYPALVLSAFRPAAVLKGGPVAASGGVWVRQALVVAQFAVLIMLLLATLTIYRQTMFALNDATRTDNDGVLILFAAPCSDALRDNIRTLPGVRSAACSSPAAVELNRMSDMVEANRRRMFLNYSPVDFGFLELYGIRPVAGRLFSRERPGDDGARLRETPPAVVLNESAVRALGFKSPQDAVGQSLRWHFAPEMAITKLGAPTPPWRSSEVIGVVPDFSFGSVRQKVSASFFYVGPKTDALSSVALHVKIDPARTQETVAAIEKTWKAISGGQPLQEYFAGQFLLRLYIDNIIQGGFIAVCALIAVSIACLGLFALSAFTTERRTKEIGVRKAMGASTADIVRLLLWQFTRPVLAACVIALPLAWLVMDWWLKGFAYRVDLAPWTFAAAAAAAILIAWATVFAHALRVARARPVAALRYE